MDPSPQITNLEIALLRNILTGDISQNLSFGDREANIQNDDSSLCVKVVNCILNGKFDDVIDIAISLKILKPRDQNDPPNNQEPGDSATHFVNQTENSRDTRRLIILCVGVASLQLFVQNNWVGPLSDAAPPHHYEVDSASLASSLSADGDTIHPAVRYPGYLAIARHILLECHDTLPSLTRDWWCLHYIQIHQGLLEERSPTLKATAADVIKRISKLEEIMANDEFRDLAIQFHLEAGHMCYFYYEPRQAKEHFDQAEKLCGVDISLTGALGKRTRFQEKEHSQLVLQVSPLDGLQPWSPPDENTCAHLPKDVSLDDDTVLEKIKLSDEDQNLVCRTSGTQQSVILGLCHRHRKTREGHGQILEEECLAYVNGVLQTPRSWNVQTSALLMRSLWECDSSRRMQRSMSQMEELVSQVRRPEPGVEHRLGHVYCTKLPPIWEIQRHLAVLFEKAGAINAALEVYQRIAAWEDVIKCYTHLGKKEKADKLIREQLAVKETPSLWCYLGDVHGSEKYYQKAWEFSGAKYGRAQRSLAYLYLRQQNFEQCLPCFEKCLQVNALQIGVWFSYGCAALACHQYDTAAKAFRRCVNLDSDNFQAWSNLATAYIRSKQKGRAFTVLQEALKCEFENWRIWDNYMLVSTDIGEFDESIRSYHRILDLRDKHTDVEVLGVLTKALTNNLKDAHDRPAASLKPKILELFGRITSKITSNADVWRLYAESTTSGTESVSQTEREKALQYLQKSHRSNTQAVNWEKDIGKCQDVLNQSVGLAKAYISCSMKTSESAQACQMLGSARLMVKGILAKVKQNQTDAINGEIHETLHEGYNLLEQQLAIIMETIQAKQS